MRLIDIDKHFKLNEALYRADIEVPLHRVKYALESLPTVEAIPIEWIKKWCGNEPYWSNLAMHLIEDWGKENGDQS